MIYMKDSNHEDAKFWKNNQIQCISLKITAIFFINDNKLTLKFKRKKKMSKITKAIGKMNNYSRYQSI